VGEVIGIFRHETVEELFQIASRGGVGIFHDNKAATGVLDKHRDCSISHSAIVDLGLHLIGDFVETFAVGADFELVVVEAHFSGMLFDADVCAKERVAVPGSLNERVARASRLHSLVMRKRGTHALLQMQSDIERVLFDAPAIHKRLDEMATQISADYADRELTVIAILTGTLMFMSDLLRRIPLPLKLDCLSVASYHGKTQTSGEVIFKQPGVPDVGGRDVLILDDILDTGHTLAAVRKKLETAKPRSIRVCVLLSKRKQRAREVDADYFGFEIDDDFVVGYGLDFMERYRNLPYIGVLRKELLEQPDQ
jgi:hypoxanthine phosphoribosyltransferase